MLRSTRRIDIEDKGCSGETFLGTTEILYQEQPKFTIFENVIGAPWGKMAEYVTGRAKLSDCDSSKAVSIIKGECKDLSFALDGKTTIIVDYVPSFYGIRCGAVVEGIIRGDSNSVSKIQWPKNRSKTKSKSKAKTKTRICTLTELMDHNNISKENDTLVLKTPCTYCTKICKVDTKLYGLPQTRMRTYMFVWQPDNGDINDDLGLYWSHIVKYLESPVRHALEGFILNVDHDIIRVFREALRGPPGRQTMRNSMQETDFWTSSNANLPHNKNVRAALGLKDRARFMTKWGPYGQRQVPPNYWVEYINCQSQRSLDMIDILHASAARDAESHDTNFSSFFWNISQNVSKEKHRSAVAGIASCVTPGGEIWIPKEGRPLLGCEKLLLQGIPYFRLALGNETEVQLGDLAGNAMSLPVVCATMLAAISSRQLRNEIKANHVDDIPKYLREHCVLEGYQKSSRWGGEIQGSNYEGDMNNGSEDSLTFLASLAALADEAIQASVWCTCETSGSMSTTTSVLECSCCRISCYRNCINSTSGYNLESHDTKSVERINNSSDIQSKLRNIIPSTLYLEKGGILQLAGLRNDEARVRGLEKFVFQLHRLKRERKRMAIVYYAKDNNGVGENIAELKLLVGELKRTAGHAIKGVSLELKSFLPALTEPLVYGLLDPCAKLIVPTDAEEGIWMGLAPEIEASVTVIGEGEIDSFRVDVGLTDIVASDLIHEKDKRQHKKDFASADSRNETRRWLYPDNWKVWPKTTTIKDAPQVQGRPNINGTYVRSRCRQTTTQSALWIRDDIYLLMRPNVSRTGPDIAIISTSINHEDTSSVVAVFERNWIPSDSLISKHHRQTISFKLWKEIPKMRCRIPHTKLVVTSPRDESDLLLSVHGLRDTELRRFVLEEGRQKLNLTHGPKAQQTVRVFNSLCVAPTLKYTAQNGLKFDTRVQADWLNLSSNIPFGTCDNTVPPRPTESWYWDSERDSWQRSSEPGASRNYYLQLQQAPQPFEVWIDKDENSLEVIASPTTAGHHAVSQLVGGRGGINMHEQVSVKFRLSNIALQSDPITAPFQVHNCHSCTPTNILLKAPHKLYDRQQKVVTKMLDIENGNTPFEELEMAEFEMPGQTGLSLIAKATRPRKICGGVIADAIGAGKTVISIALILKGLADARSKQKVPNQSGATLVVVPPGLIDQWEGEIKKFATSALRVVKVYGGDKTKSTSNYKVEDIIKADVVIVNVNILDSKGYFENLLDMAGLRDEVKNIPKLPSYTGQQEQIQARGVWIPNTSQDPYAGGNNPRNQSRRNESAFYTYLYNRAVQEIRKKIFTAKSKRVPLEYFEYQRVIVDEVHESLCTTKAEIPVATKSDKKVALKKKTATKKKTTDKKAAPKKKNLWKESNRRAGREFLGITQKDQSKRLLRARKAVFGLTGTPLLDSTSRIIELANLIGGTYVIGLSSHWRKLERESCRDIFLHNYLEPRQSREVRKNINSKCQSFLDTACTRNKGEKQMEGIKLVEEVKVVNMTKEEGKLYLVSQHGISPGKRHMSNRPDDFDPSAGHDISRILCQNAQFESRGTILIEICNGILEKDPKTKIVVFTDGRIGAGEAARDALVKSGLGCTCLDREDSVEETNKKIAWYQYGDATEEDKRRPRVLVLHFAHAAGLNLQTECYNMILFTPLYIGAGGTSGDAVADASTELQAIGRVYRPGQPQPFVFVYRIEVKGPANEECFDGQLIRRNTDKETIDMAINSGE